MKRVAIAAAVAALIAGTAHAAEMRIYKQHGFQGPSQSIKGEVANLEGGFAGETSSIVATGGYWEVCTEHHFAGTCRLVPPGEHPRLGQFNDRIVSVRFLGNDERFAKRAQEEQRLAMRAREERLAMRDDRREWRDDRREWREGRRWEQAGAIDLYGRSNFRGRSVRVDDNTRDLSELNFDGRASSAIVHDGTWQLCTEPGFRGRCAVLKPGDYAQLAQLDDRVSSVRRLR